MHSTGTYILPCIILNRLSFKLQYYTLFSQQMHKIKFKLLKYICNRHNMYTYIVSQRGVNPIEFKRFINCLPAPNVKHTKPRSSRTPFSYISNSAHSLTMTVHEHHMLIYTLVIYILVFSDLLLTVFEENCAIEDISH